MSNDMLAEPARKEIAAPPAHAKRAPVWLAVALLVALVLGFLGYVFGLSRLSEQRAQTNLRKTFAHALGQAVAPVGPVEPGTPVAAISIPRLGLDQTIVVEGTSAQDLTLGPGHRRDTVLPGQTGVSVIYGRRVSFGGPFAHLMQLQVGDQITVTTGQGAARYRVSSFGDAQHPAPANSTNRLVLATADSTGWPHESVSVSADLQTAPKPAGPARPAIPTDEESMAGGAGGSALAALLWSQALLAIAVLIPILAVRWSPIATYVCAAPLVLAVVWNLYENAACALPNLY
ncbi:MAG TPA: sortase [Jatrophihabitans sp.]|jgi:sortase (surface protein transpeptidase)